MSDEEVSKPSVMPDQPKTMELPAANPLEIAIARLTAAVDKGFTETRADLESVKNEGQRTNLRLTRLEMRQDDVETRLTRTSTRVQSVSEQDVSHDAQLAQERAAREALAKEVADLKTSNATQLSILTRLDTITQKPLVKTLAAMLVTAAITWLAAHGVHIQ